MAQDPTKPLSDIAIARQAKMQRIEAIAEKAGIPDEAFEPYGSISPRSIWTRFPACRTTSTAS
jgi:hypothetical protein